MKTLIVLISIAIVSWGDSVCQYQLNDDIKVQWIAFKTPLKVGVKGSFDSIKLQQQKADSFSSMLLNTHVNIKTNSANTKNSSRDATLVEFFFKPFSPVIQGKIVEIEQQRQRMKIQFSMNDIQKSIPFTYEVNNNILKAQGLIDILDFKGATALESINRTCYDLHEGKTWNDVKVSFQISFSKKCQ